MRWRLGYHGVATPRGFPRHAFGHFGFGGSGAWAEANRELAVGMIVNSGLGTPFGDLRIVRISGAALACTDRLRNPVLPQRRRVAPFMSRAGKPAAEAPASLSAERG